MKKMKTIKFQTSPGDEWLVSASQIMYRCQDGSLYDDDIQWENCTLVEAVKAMLDAKYPRLPIPRIIEQLQGTELGDLISQHQEGKLIFVPISVFEEWEQNVSVLHDKLIQLGELPDGLSEKEEGFLNNKFHHAWDLYLEIFCQQANLPSRCWVEIENSRGGLEVIEVVNRKPQYRVKSSFGNGIQFSKFFDVIE